jgi:predicted RNA-binding Zn-ribbon protein involved in translation (DUF1610 family)
MPEPSQDSSKDEPRDFEQEVMKEESKKVRNKLSQNNAKTEPEVIHSEPVDTIVKCPSCGKNKVNWVFTKRGASLKCMSCGFDTHVLQDVFSHRRKELEVLPILKEIFSQLIFKENVPIDTDIFSGEIGHAKTRYDFGVYWFSKKIAKCKVAVLQNTTRDNYLNAEEQYIQGRPKVFEYLSKINAIMVFYFVDEPDNTKKIAMADCREMKKFAVMVKDRFNNDQYHLNKEIRKVIIKTSFKDFQTLIFRNFYDLITEGVYIV